jgi:hypothetical protein
LLDRGGVQYGPTRTAHSIRDQDRKRTTNSLLACCKVLATDREGVSPTLSVKPSNFSATSGKVTSRQADVRKTG